MSTSTSAARCSGGRVASAASSGATPLAAHGGLASRVVGRGRWRSAADPRSPYSSRSSGSGVGPAYLRRPDAVEAGVDHDPVQPGGHRSVAAEGAGPPVRRDQAVLEPVGGVVRGCPSCAGRPPRAGRGGGRTAGRRRRGRRPRGRRAARRRCGRRRRRRVLSHRRPRLRRSRRGSRRRRTARRSARPRRSARWPVVAARRCPSVPVTVAAGDLEALEVWRIGRGDVDAALRSASRPWSGRPRSRRGRRRRSSTRPTPVFRPPGPSCWS